MLRWLLRLISSFRRVGRRPIGTDWRKWWEQEQQRRREARKFRKLKSAEYWGVSPDQLPDWDAEQAQIEAPKSITDWRERWEYERDQRRAVRAKRKQRYRELDRKAHGEDLWGTSVLQRRAGVHEAKLHRFGLPILRTERDLADWLEIPLTGLRWFSHDKPAEKVWHYVRYTLPKRGGGERVILAPKHSLKKLQQKVLRGMLAKIPMAENAHGFRSQRSIATNARPHVGKQFVLNMDLKDFFPSITFPRVRGLLIALGYPFSVASALALLCTERDRETYDLDGKRYYVSVGPRCLVQGAPTSPAFANLIARRLDLRLNGIAQKQGVVYTRYADDLTFSGNDLHAVLRVLDVSKRIIGDEHFAVNPAKTRLHRRSSRQIVTGLVVNDRLGTPRRLRRRLRAILHNAQKTGLDSQNRNGCKDFRAHIVGLIGFINAANAEHALRLTKALQSV